MKIPDKNQLFPLKGYKRLCFLKNTIKSPNIIVGDYTYYDDFDDVYNFEKNVKYHFDFIGDRLVIGKFCMIASGVTFIMNGANHKMDGITAYLFLKTCLISPENRKKARKTIPFMRQP